VNTIVTVMHSIELQVSGLHSKELGVLMNVESQVNTIEEFAKFIAPELLRRHGRVFCSGRDAFARQAPVPLYILGLNPGGNPEAPTSETIEQNNKGIMAHAKWSAFCDESWAGKPPGTHGMQPRVRSMFNELNIDLRQTPASNLIFVRTQQQQNLLENNLMILEELCWQFHKTVIERLRPQAILCFGRIAGLRVLVRLGQHLQQISLDGLPKMVDRFVEQNDRRWKSEGWEFPSGHKVIIATHPSRANWTDPAASPTPLVKRMLG
jgi:hypothetical protein